jgi:hypothetical protein
MSDAKDPHLCYAKQIHWASNHAHEQIKSLESDLQSPFRGDQAETRTYIERLKQLEGELRTCISLICSAGFGDDWLLQLMDVSKGVEHLADVLGQLSSAEGLAAGRTEILKKLSEIRKRLQDLRGETESGLERAAV